MKIKRSYNRELFKIQIIDIHIIKEKNLDNFNLIMLIIMCVYPILYEICLYNQNYIINIYENCVIPES